MSTKLSRKIFLAPLAGRLTAIGVALLPRGQAVASQGPGTTPGSAGAMTQLAMAIIVYGGAGLVLAAGFVGAIRQRRRGEGA
jgi:hypothetical protein